MEEKKERESFENFRKNSLNSQFGKWFELDFFAISNGTYDDHVKNLHNTLETNIIEQGESRTITYLHEYYKKSKKVKYNL